MGDHGLGSGGWNGYWLYIQTSKPGKCRGSVRWRCLWSGLVSRWAAQQPRRTGPHCGGVGLCEYVQNIALFDYIAVSASSQQKAAPTKDASGERYLLFAHSTARHPPTAQGVTPAGRPQRSSSTWARRSTACCSSPG
ncbi:MAG: hypothetical protein E6Q70_06595 [Pseudomonas monteilii]|nr:MAG: hypothetical protein E6Q70_06595 [Pseudomonas monteilii]